MHRRHGIELRQTEMLRNIPLDKFASHLRGGIQNHQADLNLLRSGDNHVDSRRITEIGGNGLHGHAGLRIQFSREFIETLPPARHRNDMNPAGRGLASQLPSDA